MARDLRELWPWLKQDRLVLVAATLGAALGDQWTAAAVVDFVDRHRAGQALPVEIHSATGLLRDLLQAALTDRVQPPFQARRRDEHQQQLTDQHREASVAGAQDRRTAVAIARAEHAERAEVAAQARTGGAARARAALAAARGTVAAEDQDEQDGWPAVPPLGTAADH